MGYRRGAIILMSSNKLGNGYIPDFSYVLYDLAQFTDDKIKGAVMGRVAMLLFKYLRPEGT